MATKFIRNFRKSKNTTDIICLTAAVGHSNSTVSCFWIYCLICSPSQDEGPARIQQPYASNAVSVGLARSGGSDDKFSSSCEGRLERSRGTSEGCRQQPSPAISQPTPRTGTCLRRAATKVRGKRPRTLAEKISRVDGPRRRRVWLDGAWVSRAWGEMGMGCALPTRHS